MPTGYLTEGLTISLVSAGSLALIFMLITAHRAAYNTRELDECIVLISLGLSAFTSLVCVIYPITNLALLAHQQQDLWKSMHQIDPYIRYELSTGVLALRITSVAVGFTATRSLWDALRLDPLPATPDAAKPLYQYTEAISAGTEALPVYRNRFAQTAINLVQSGFYELNILLLWMIKLLHKDSAAVALLSWALFYIIDDWRIIFRFSLALKGRFMREHIRQVNRTNWLIMFAGLWCAWSWSPIACFFYFLCAALLYRLILYVGYGMLGSWRIAGALDWKFYDQIIDHATGQRKAAPPSTLIR